MSEHRGTTLRARRGADGPGALMAVGAMTLTGCDFSVYSLPLPGGADLGENPYEGQGRVQRRSRPGAAVRGQGRRRDGRKGRRASTSTASVAEVTVLIVGDVKLPDNAEAHDPADQPARGEVRVAGTPLVGGAGAGRPGGRWPGSRSSGAGATPRSRKCSARCPCCSTAGVSPSSGGRAQQGARGPGEQRQVRCSPSSRPSWASSTRTRTQIVQAIESLEPAGDRPQQAEAGDHARAGPSCRVRSPRSTGSATTW